MSISKQNMLSLLLLAGTPAMAMTWQYDNLDAYALTCRLVSWGGAQPTSGKLKIHDTYTVDDVTYTVTEIAPHALDHLTTVVSIEIPATIVSIGNAEADSRFFSIDNFADCPMLEKFIVASGNTKYAATSAGILVSKNTKKLYRVPQAISLSQGTLGLSSSIEYIGNGAFSGNSTVVSLSFGSMIQSISYKSGLMEMEAVETFRISSNDSYVSRDGVLYSKSNTLMAYPPAKPAESYTAYSGTKSIGTCAFANSKHLQTVSFPSTVTSISEKAFMRSEALKSVQTSSKITSIGDSAFCECPSLVDFPFSAATKTVGTRAFAGSAFTEVVYNYDAVTNGAATGLYQFEGCENLEKIDMSAVSCPDWVQPYSIAPGFAAGCPKLAEVTLPARVAFASTADALPAFGDDSAIAKVVVGSFTVAPGSEVIGYRGGSHSPMVYAAVKGGSDAEQIPFSMMFGSAGDATVTPSIYCDLYTPSEADKADDLYVYPGATYYVPGSAAPNYSDAAAAGCAVREMFALTITDVAGNAETKCLPAMPDVVINRVEFNGTEGGTPDADGLVDAAVAYSEIADVKVYFTVSGVDMMTVYPGVDKIPSAVEHIDADDADAPAEYFDMMGRKVECPAAGGTYIVRRGSKVTKALFN